MIFLNRLAKSLEKDFSDSLWWKRHLFKAP